MCLFKRIEKYSESENVTNASPCLMFNITNRKPSTYSCNRIKTRDIFQTIQFSTDTQCKCLKQFYFKQFS